MGIVFANLPGFIIKRQDLFLKYPGLCRISGLAELLALDLFLTSLPFCLHQMRSCLPSEVETESKFGCFGYAELYNKLNCMWKRMRG